MTEERTDLERQLRDIQKWEKAQQRVMFWQTFTRLPFQLLDKLTPQFIQRKIGLILDETGTFIQSGGQYLTSEKRIMKKFQKRLPHGTCQTLHDIRNAPLAVMDEIAEAIARTSVKAATVQGAATGVGGVFTLAADIPAMLGLSLKTLQDIAVAYGFDPKDKKERVFIVKLLQLASSDVIGKKAILQDLRQYDQNDQTYQRVASQIQGWREVVYSYRDTFAAKKLLQMVPAAGIIFGASANRSALESIAETGIMLYKKRRILKRMKDTE